MSLTKQEPKMSDKDSGQGMALTDWGIPGTYVFDHTRSPAGYELNKLAYR